MSVNFDGMTTAVYDSFTLWLQTAPYDIVLMQETHRGFGANFAEWQAGAWIFISSPDDKSRFAGVAVAIRTSLATSTRFGAYQLYLAEFYMFDSVVAATVST